MTAPRIEIDLVKIRRNARFLVDRLAQRGVAVAGVTKAVCGHPGVARAMLDGGVAELADARVSNVARLRAAGIDAPIMLIRTPMRSEADHVVRTCDISLNTDFGVVEALARAARRAGRVHRVIPMVEMGDRREGMPPEALADFARRVLALRGVALAGVGANVACMSGRAPDRAMVKTLSALVSEVEYACDVTVECVSGGNSASLSGILDGGWRTRVNHLRLGEAILLGRDPVTRLPIEGLSTDAFVLAAEVIESASGAQRAGASRSPSDGVAPHDGWRSLLALGDQDTDTAGLAMPGRLSRLGSTSDHLLLCTGTTALAVGAEVRFSPDYAALMRAMNASDIAKIVSERNHPRQPSLQIA